MGSFLHYYQKQKLLQRRFACVYLICLRSDLRVHELSSVGDVLLEERHRERRAVVLGAGLVV